MQYNNPKFNAGDVLVCVDTERSGLTLGAEYLATYAKKSTKDTNGGMITLGDGLVYFGKRFVLKSTLTNKEQAMNSMVVADLTPKKQRKLAIVLDSLGYTFDHDFGLAHHMVVRFDDKSYSTNFGGHARRNTDRVYIYAAGKKYKAILAEVLAALPMTDDNGNPVEVPQVFEVGCTVERTDGEHEGMEVGATSVVTALKEDGIHVELEDYSYGHSKRMLKVIKGA